MALRTLAQAGLISLQLLFPDQTEKTLTFKSREVADFQLFYPSETGSYSFLDGAEGEAWARSFSLRLKKALLLLQDLVRVETELKCSSELSSRSAASLDVYLVPSENFPQSWGGETGLRDRLGYNHPRNPGPLIQVKQWNTEAIEALTLHEAVHRWCDSSATSTHSKWLEEGAADFIAAKVSGQTPQVTITRYFDSPLQPTLYGSSYLWYLARQENKAGTRQGFLKTLASLHLGMRSDLVFGGQKKAVPPHSRKQDEADTPHGFILGATPRNTFSLKGYDRIPYRVQPWGEIDIAPALPQDSDRTWIWRGPTPTGLQ